MHSNKTTLQASIAGSRASALKASVTSSSGSFASGPGTVQPNALQLDAGVASPRNPVDANLGQIVYGLAATVEVGTVTTGEEASVTNRGTSQAAVLDFVLPRGPQGPPGAGWTVGDGLLLNQETNVLSVDTADHVEKDNTRPITAAAVFTEVGNINALLATI